MQAKRIAPGIDKQADDIIDVSALCIAMNYIHCLLDYPKLPTLTAHAEGRLRIDPGRPGHRRSDSDIDDFVALSSRLRKGETWLRDLDDVPAR